MPRPNWFFGFPIDGAFVLTLPEPPAAFRRYHPDDIHMTLAFLGGSGEPAALRALAALDQRLAASPPEVIDVALGEVVPMGSRKAYSALSALLGDGRAEAGTLITALRDPLTLAANGRREQRPAKPHVTLARPMQRATDADREAGKAWASALELGKVRARLDRVALYTWADVRRERLFEVVEERRLG